MYTYMHTLVRIHTHTHIHPFIVSATSLRSWLTKSLLWKNKVLWTLHFIKSPSGSIEMIMCFALIALFNTFSVQHLLSIYYVISHFNKKQTHTINYKPEKLSYLVSHS